jgi:hypothetical protein
MTAVDRWTRKGKRRPPILEDFRQAQPCEDWQIRLELKGVPAQCKERAWRKTVIVIEQMVSEVRREGNRLDEKEPRHQRGGRRPSPVSPVPSSLDAHGGRTLPD